LHFVWFDTAAGVRSSSTAAGFLHIYALDSSAISVLTGVAAVEDDHTPAVVASFSCWRWRDVPICISAAEEVDVSGRNERIGV